MPLRDDYYYRAVPGRFLTSELRDDLTRAQWGIYRDLIDLLHMNGGEFPSGAKTLTRLLLPDTPEDLEAVLRCKHVYRTEAGMIRHRIVDEDLKDLDKARAKGSELGRRSAEARARQRAVQRGVEQAVEQPVQRGVEREGQRAVQRRSSNAVGHPHSLTHSVSEREVLENGGPSSGLPRSGPADGALPSTPAPMPDEVRAALAAMGVHVPRRRPPPPPTDDDPKGGDPE